MNLESIPDIDAQIEWNEDDEGCVTESLVFNRQIARPAGTAHVEKFMNSNGACSADWLQGDARATPEGVFANMSEQGFADEEQRLSALEQFGKIEGASWARLMAEAMRLTLRARAGLDDDSAAIETPVYGADLTGDGTRLPYFIGHQWKVDADGIDTVDETYFIEADRLGELYQGMGKPISSWLPHLAEKTWVDMREFEQAFRCALVVHEGKYTPLPPGALENGLDLARRERR